MEISEFVLCDVTGGDVRDLFCVCQKRTSSLFDWESWIRSGGVRGGGRGGRVVEDSVKYRVNIANNLKHICLVNGYSEDLPNGPDLLPYIMVRKKLR